MNKRAVGWCALVVGVVSLFVGNFRDDRKPEMTAVQENRSEEINIDEVSHEASIFLNLEAVRRVQLGDFISAAAICSRSAFLDSSECNCTGYIIESFNKKMAGLKSAAISQEASGFPVAALMIAQSLERTGKMEAPE